MEASQGIYTCNHVDYTIKGSKGRVPSPEVKQGMGGQNKPQPVECLTHKHAYLRAWNSQNTVTRESLHRVREHFEQKVPVTTKKYFRTEIVVME